MKSYSIFIISIVLSVLHWKCDQKADTNVLINDIKSCTITEGEIPIEINSFIKSKNTIQLEQSDSALLSGFSAVKLFNKEIYILDSKKGKIFVFDLLGNFKRNIGRPGKGPGELLNATDFIIDSTKNAIEILDWQAMKIKKYTFEGQHIDDIQLNDVYSSFYKFDNEVYLFSKLISNYTQAFDIDLDTDYSMVYGKIDDKAYFLPYREQMIFQGNLRYERNCFSQYKDGVLFWEIFNDTIYHIIEGSVEYKYHINFKDKSIPLELLRKPLNERLKILNMDKNKNKYRGLINDVIGFNDWIIFSYTFNGKNFIYWNIEKNIVNTLDDKIFQNHCLFKVSNNKFISIGFIIGSNIHDSDVELSLFEIQ